MGFLNDKSKDEQKIETKELSFKQKVFLKFKMKSNNNKVETGIFDKENKFDIKNKVADKWQTISKKETRHIEKAVFTIFFPNMQTETKKLNIIDGVVTIRDKRGKSKEMYVGDSEPFIISANSKFGGKMMYYADFQRNKILSDDEIEVFDTGHTPEEIKRIPENKFLRALLKRRNLVQRSNVADSPWKLIFSIVFGFGMYHLLVVMNIIKWGGVA